MKLSIVTTLYRSHAYLSQFYERARATAGTFALEDYEIVMVNDGSPDQSLELAVELAGQDEHVVVVDLSRNFGHHKAMMTGLAHASGDLVFLIDCDLEESPEWLTEFADTMEEKQCDVVYGVQQQRKGGWFERVSGQCFWSLFNTLSDISLPANIVTARLMTRRYVEALLQHQEREVFMAGLWHITGYDQVAQMVRKLSNAESTYTFRRKVSLFVNSITSFSNTPLIGIFYLGLGISLLAVLYVFWLLVHWLFFNRPPTGWTSVMASIWLIGGMLMSCVGVIGIYLSKIFSETKRRPYTIVRQVYRRES
ncbi:glycosyltransferase family 2 protein [Ralstonia insidiosa]|uniref:Glycosyl transferase n=1 Tax=Ralstonia insidiosa TaxID=190721 RepID=A0A192A2C1_9RALS|nr:glycosyltransferase family 2 protein [Ralstonia insidiosa]ANJ74442.1 glycosyl transferase [Ralstonia insidiosa]KAB0472937.1 glycosyltransferase family 2 protein [Ralstonia insidiosa]MBY4907435.1 glycosyltransferase family 2 protein [Ralstonia insidiosa]